MNSKKILVLEDDRLTRTVISEILKSAGYEVYSAAEAATAVRIAREQKPDLITLDIVLAVQSPSDLSDGLRVGAWVKRLGGEGKTPKIIVISSLDPTKIKASIDATQPHTFLPKPVEKTKLLAAVADALVDSPADSSQKN